MTSKIDHIIIGSPNLELGIEWVESRLSVAPVFGGVHAGFGTHNALLGLGDAYLEVLAPDPGQSGANSQLLELVRSLSEPALISVVIAKQNLNKPFSMSRVRADGVVLNWDLEFTSTPLFFIDWKNSPRPSGLPDGGAITSLRVTTPEPAHLDGIEIAEVLTGPIWSIEASIDGEPLK